MTDSVHVLKLPYPPSVNRYWRHARGRHYISSEGQEFRDAVDEIIGRTASRYDLDGALEVQMFATAPDKRSRDLDNLWKAVLDALTCSSVWFDDSQIVDLRSRWCGKPEKPGQITIIIARRE